MNGPWESLRAEYRTETVVIVDIIVVHVGTGVIARNPRVIVVVLLGEPLFRYCEIFIG